MFRKILIMILILLNIFFIYCYADEENEEEYDDESINEIVLETSATEMKEPILNAKAWIVYDRGSKEIICSKNSDEKRAMASTTKIMTAIVVIEKCNLQDVVTISRKAANTGGSCLKIKEGDKITVKDLLYGLMLRSGNDAAVALTEFTGGSIEGFAELMNKKAQELGLINTHFVTPHGLDNEKHYTTAYELAILTDYALNNEIFKNIVNTKYIDITINGMQRTISNTNELLGNIQGVNGVKTGFTGNAGRCLVTSCTRGENQIITVVLGCDTKKQRTTDSIKLIEYAFNNYTRVNLEEKVQEEFEKWKQINKNRIYINKGENKEIKLEISEIKRKVLPIKNGEENDINIEINAIYNYEAPLDENKKIGNIIVKKKDEIIETIDIKNSSKINKKNVLYYFIELLTFYNNFGIIDMH